MEIIKFDNFFASRVRSYFAKMFYQNCNIITYADKHSSYFDNHTCKTETPKLENLHPDGIRKAGPAAGAPEVN